MTLLVDMFGKFLFSKKTLFEIVPVFAESHGKRSACFVNVASPTFTANAIEALCHLLLISFWPSFHE
jgi:hypothetical protein